MFRKPMNIRCAALACLLLSLLRNAMLCDAPTPLVVTIHSGPDRPLIEFRGESQFLNFDLIVKNDSALALRISQIQLDVFDSKSVLAARKSLNNDAFAPGMAVIGNQVLAPGQSLDIFNPFSQFESSVPLAKLQFWFCLLRESNDQDREKNRHRLPDDCDFRQQLTITPRSYEDKTGLILPLRGRIFVWEGHDLYAHHLRVPLGDRKLQALGSTANSNQFAQDFIYLDSQGRPSHDDPRELRNWYSYGQPIYAPGAGSVLMSPNDIPDNRFEDARATQIGYPRLASDKDPKGGW